MSARNDDRRRLLIRAVGIAFALSAALSRSACAPDKEAKWAEAKRQNIIAFQGTNGVYVTGGLIQGIDSKMELDYKFAYEASEGGIKESLASKFWSNERFTSDRVTIYEDVAPGDPAYIALIEWWEWR